MGTQATFMRGDLRSLQMVVISKKVTHSIEQQEDHWEQYGEALEDYYESYLETGTDCKPFVYTEPDDPYVTIDWKAGGNIRTTLEPIIGSLWYQVY